MKQRPSAEEVIKKLNLVPLPLEGGFFRQTYKTDATVPAELYGILSDSPRAYSTAIYYLVTPESFSALHRVKSDEMFHFYAGDAVEMLQISADGKPSLIQIGADLFHGEIPQVMVRRGDWQGLKLKPGGQWALLGCTVSPGFEYEDFELGNRAELTAAYPALKDLVAAFTNE